jgi:hypothetical protein
MLYVTQANLVNPAEITVPISGNIEPSDISYYDADGFQLNTLEQRYYKQNDIPVLNCLGVYAAHYPWICLEPTPNFVLDHSLIISRCSFAGEAREQIAKFAQTYPQLRKYLLLQPKWGIDFALEYYTDTDYIEVLHIEQDYNNHDQAQEAKERTQQRILGTDWHDFAKNVLARKHEWIHLQGMSRNDWKARYWGLDRAERTLKAF